MRQRKLALSLLVLGLACLLPNAALARIKLITLPVRERVEIQLDNPHATLVEEERIVPLVRGRQPGRFLLGEHADRPQHDRLSRDRPEPGGRRRREAEGRAAKPAAAPEAKPLDVKVLSVSYPPNEAALVWQVSSSDSGLGPRAHQLPPGQPQQELQLPGRRRPRRKHARALRVHAAANLANESFGSTGLWAGFGPRFLKPIGINETKEMLDGEVRQGPDQEDLHLRPAAFGWLDRPQNKLLVPMHYVLKNDKANGLGAGAAAIRQGPHLPGRRPRRHGVPRRGLGQVHARWTTRCGSTSAWPRTWSSSGRSTRTSRRRVAGNLYDREVVVKYEIENFKDKAVTLDVSENVRAIRNEVVRRHGPGRRVGTGQGDHVRGRARQGEEHLRAAALPRQAAGPRGRRQGREDRPQAPPHHQERMVRP